MESDRAGKATLNIKHHLSMFGISGIFGIPVTPATRVTPVTPVTLGAPGA